MKVCALGCLRKHSIQSCLPSTVVPIALYKDCAKPIACDFVLIEQREHILKVITINHYNIDTSLLHQ